MEERRKEREREREEKKKETYTIIKLNFGSIWKREWMRNKQANKQKPNQDLIY